MRNIKVLQRAIFLAAVVVLALSWKPLVTLGQGPSEPEIRITDVPPSTSGGPNEMFPIAGTVTGVAAKDHRVVIYAYAGAQWWVQPFDYAPLTEIKSNGKFETETHGGSIYAVLLVKPSYKPKPTLTSLPDVGGDIIARHRVAGKKE